MPTQLEIALSYARAGIPVFPCRAGEEYDAVRDEVLKPKTPILGNGFKGATLNERVITIRWQQRPDAMIGIPTGEQSGCWVLDVDVHKDDDGKVINGYETLAALEDKYGQLPRTAVVRTAGGGEHHYFRHKDGVRNRGRLGPGLDVRGAGGYVVTAGSVTADGTYYEWLDFDGDGFPELPDAPEWLLNLVLPAADPAPQRQYVYDPSSATQTNTAYVDRAVSDELSKLAHTAQGGRGEAVNASAFNLGTFVGAGLLARHEAEAGLYDAAYSNGVVAKDGEREIRAKIKRGLDAGIKQPRAIPAPEYNLPDWDGFAIAERMRNKTAPAPDDPPPIPDYKPEAVGDLEDLTYPGGLVQDLVDWIVSSSQTPSRTLALAAVLPMLAALAGPRYSTGARDTRPNIYTVALADSGFGKEHARSQIKRLLMNDAGVFESYAGPARIMSASALREILEENQSVCCQIDEFGGFIRDITDRKAGGHQRAISTDLRDYYSASSTFFEGAAYRGVKPKRVYNPCLCIYGTSTPEQFWTALSAASAEDGLLPRLILFHVKGERPPDAPATRDVRDVPYILMERMAKVAGINVAKKRGDFGRTGYKKERTNEPVRPIVVPWTDGALALFTAARQAIDEDERKVAPECRPFVRRILENAIKLALIVAVGVDPEQPRITEANFDWACAVAKTCAADMIAEVEERLADNQREANYKRIAGLIRRAKTGLTEGKIADRCKAIDARQRKEILEDLLISGAIRVPDNDNKRGPKARKYVWAG